MQAKAFGETTWGRYQSNGVSLDGLCVVRPEAEPCDDVAVDAEALLLDVAGHGEGRAQRAEEDQEEEILKVKLGMCMRHQERSGPTGF